jgi:hypothetical protein
VDARWLLVRRMRADYLCLPPARPSPPAEPEWRPPEWAFDAAWLLVVFGSMALTAAVILTLLC